jgi:hypothetical protein
MPQFDPEEGNELKSATWSRTSRESAAAQVLRGDLALVSGTARSIGRDDRVSAAPAGLKPLLQ